MPEPQKMIPCTESLMHEMLANVMRVMQERGLIQRVGTDDDALLDQIMNVLDLQGQKWMDDDVVIGQCVLLPPRPPRELGFSLLLITPCPADEYDDELRRKPFPIQFDRTAQGEVILPARWLITQLERLAENPAAATALQTMALQLSRRADIRDMVMPREMTTVAITVNNADGTQSVYEAIPGGGVLDLDFEIEEG